MANPLPVAKTFMVYLRTCSIITEVALVSKMHLLIHKLLLSLATTVGMIPYDNKESVLNLIRK
ncbi:MAG: hypothetical protein HQK50_08340 [Oligoflexia bacterium]|nr:hypothetical protein [Oligoflexia bacterium]MBF0365567.1 hypothetical protein [Oligoflexia bacterium]